jgi:hypothetical protein
MLPGSSQAKPPHSSSEVCDRVMGWSGEASAFCGLAMPAASFCSTCMVYENSASGLWTILKRMSVIEEAMTRIRKLPLLLAGVSHPDFKQNVKEIVDGKMNFRFDGANLEEG